MGINPHADQKVIKAAYRTLMFRCRCHPDLGGSGERAREINEAYDVLSDIAQRKKYDLTLDPEIFNVKLTRLGYIERRRIPRINIDFNVSYKTNRGGFQTARMMDISYLGCRLQSQELIDIGDDVLINISGHMISGQVKWKRMFHPSVFQRVYESGIEFSREFEEIDNLYGA